MTNAYLAHSFVSYHVTPHYIIFIYIIYIYLHKYLDFFIIWAIPEKKCFKKGTIHKWCHYFFQFSWPLFPACRYFSFQCGINFSSVFHTPLPKTCTPPPWRWWRHLWTTPENAFHFFGMDIFLSAAKEKNKNKTSKQINKENKQMGKRSKRAIYYTTIIMLTGKNKRRKLMVALRIVQKEILFCLVLKVS